MSARRILFVLLWRSAPSYGQSTWGATQTAAMGEPGAKPLSHGLSNSAGFVVDMLEVAGLDARLVHVADDNQIWKEVDEYRPTDVIIEAFWMRPKKLDDLGARYPDVRFIVRGHSSTPFLAHDTYGFKWALDYLDKPNGIVAPNDPRFQSELRFLAGQAHPNWTLAEIRRRVPLLPNYYPADRHQRAPVKRDDSVINVGCFGAARPFKNMVGQAIAAGMFADWIGKRLRFHVNGDRIECGGGPTIRNLEWIFEAQPTAELVRHDWMPHAEFLRLVGAMDVVCQVSFAETFCIVAADAASQGVPTVTSAEVPWGASRYRADPTDTEDMARKMLRAWQERDWPFETLLNRLTLRSYANRSRRAWLEYFLHDRAA